MIRITKEEVDHLINAGYKWGVDIHRTNSNKHKYFLTEKVSALKELENFRTRITSKE